MNKKILARMVAVIMCPVLLFSGCRSSKIESEIQTMKVDGDKLVVGVISDTQLPPKAKGAVDTYPNNLRKSLTVLKNREVDVILFAGDIGDLGTKYAFETFTKIFDEVFGDKKPILQMIMGNHDYWNKSFLTAIDHKAAFKKAFNQSPWTHYVINGVHFIGASPSTGNMTEGYDGVGEWLDAEIAKAVEDTPNMPIFVMTHNQPKDTSYGSDDWGDTTLDPVLSKYPNVVNLSGHVHYSLLDERSIWQGKYTVINTQSLSYTELEEGKANGTIPPNADKTPMGYIIEITDEKVEFLRINFAKGENGYEEKSDERWVLPIPYSKDSFKYNGSRKDNNEAPKMLEGEGSFELKEGKAILKFDAGTDDDFVHSYKLVFDDNTTQLYFSDFYNGLDDMKQKVELPLINAPGGNHSVKIYAVDSYGKESTEFVTINNIDIPSI